MTVTWHTVSISTWTIEVVDRFPSLDDCIREMSLLAWEDPTNCWLDFVTDDESEEVVATAILGPGLELMVTCADGRRLFFEMPDEYGARKGTDEGDARGT